MIIKKVKYKDFRPFFGEQEIDFTCGEDKNVVVVLAQNTVGKTTIILSFIWCLYGENNFEDPITLLNKDVADALPENGKGTASVEIILEYENREYTIRREKTYRKAPNGLLWADAENFVATYVDDNGETRPCGKYDFELNETINSIIPKDLSEFFFFEGEKSNTVERKDVGDAVKKILGLDIYTNMMKHLHGEARSKASKDSVMDYFLKKSDPGANGDEINKLNAVIDSNAEKLEKVLDSIDENKGSIKEYESKRDAINDTLRSSESTQILQQERDRISMSIDRAKKRMDKSNKALFTTFSTGSFDFFLTPLCEKLRDRLNQMDMSDKGISGIEVTAINELLERHSCLCGAPLIEGSTAYKTVESYKDFLPPKSVGFFVKDMNERTLEKESLGQDFWNEFKSNYDDIMLAEKELDELDAQERECLEKLKSCPVENIEQYKKDLELYKHRLSDLYSQNEGLIEKKARLESEIERDKKRVNELIEKTGKKDKYYDYYCYAEELYNWVKTTYDEKEIVIREELQEKFAELFNKMYSGKRQATIDEYYNIHILVNGKEQALTGALHVIQYFSFIGAVVQLANEEVTRRNGETEIFGENYPLFLDAAFSHADDEHTNLIAKSLSDVTNQLVFAIMEKDWQYAKDGLAGRVQRIYEMEKISETKSIIKLRESR